MKKHKKEDQFLDQIRKVPNISVACEKFDLSRNTIYRWCKEDHAFKERLADALVNGVESINDLAESKLTSLINQGNMRAIMYWLDNNKKTYIRPRAKDFLNPYQPITAIQVLPILDEDGNVWDSKSGKKAINPYPTQNS
jgi:hypothetical protein